MPANEPRPAGSSLSAGPHRRILYVDYSIGFGGATKSLALVTDAMPQVEKFIVTCQEPNLVRTWYGGMRVFRFRRWANYRMYSRAATRLRRTLGSGWLFTVSRKLIAAIDLAVSGWNSLRLIALIRRHRIDCVHLNNGFAPLEGMVAARVAGVPCIVHMRGMAVAKKGIDLRESRRVTHTIAVSNAVAETVSRTLNVDAITTIYDPVNLSRYEATGPERAATRARLGFGDEDVVVSIFGRVVRWKGQLEFVKALARAMVENPTVVGLIVGDESDGGRDYMIEVRRAVEASGFGRRFRLIGYQPSVSALYHASDIVVHASIEPEPFGMVVPEAMAAERPIIAAAAGGPCEVVGDGVDGVLVPPGDVEAMARAIVDLAGDPERRRAMGTRGKAKVKGAFGVEHIAGQVADLYDRVLGAEPAKHGDRSGRQGS
jgi:glycosyltransferase involved in cell wall biosynthesis